ncbi:hypothetical protein [Streptomyces globosus]|uniref:hypothetical protein n=1 Tax=Streptomyces globosus TaxID=68209 RepID=UPI0013B46CB8|nr:hypothetical protein [Streptomyces globosus]
MTDEQAAAYAAFRGAPSRTELERFVFLDDADRELIESSQVRRPLRPPPADQ